MQNQQSSASAQQSPEPTLHSWEEASGTKTARHGSYNITIEGDKSAELHWIKEPQQLPGVKISAAGPARNSACMGIYTALPISSTLTSNLSSFSAELIMYD